MKNPSIDHINYFKLKWKFSNEVNLHRKVTNHIYFSELNGKPVVLRVTDSHHRNAAKLNAELEWLSFLVKSGMTVIQPIANENGNFIESTPDGQFLGAVFSKAPGQPLDPQQLNYLFIEKWGAYLGKLHKLTLNYKDPSGKKLREQWFEESSVKLALKSLDKADPLLSQRFNEIIEWLKSLPKSFDSFGLIHSDFHCGNFFVEDETIWAFDFDDSAYHWFAYDLIPALNSINYENEENNLGLDKNEIKNSFLRGYLREHNLDKIWIERLPLFERFRAALMYFWLQTKLDEGAFDDKAIEWCKKRMPLLRDQFESPLPLDPKFNARSCKLIIDSKNQIANLVRDGVTLKQYSISTAKAGLSCVEGSFGTPHGNLRVACKIGQGYPSDSIFKAKVPTGELFKLELQQQMNSDEDLVLTRILWLEGAEASNINTLTRNIYLHGTNQEHLLGTPASHGCIRFSNKDIIEVFENLDVGSEVEVS